MKGIVTRILPFSSVDGPGNRSVVFLQGCNFDCLFCHNPETIPLLKAPLAQEKKDKDHVREMDVAQVIDQLDKSASLHFWRDHFRWRMYSTV